MSRIRFGWLACAIALAVSVVGAAVVAPIGVGASSVGAVAVAPDPRPNIVLITSDDQRATDLGVMGGLRSRLAGLGVSFRFSYSSYPLCCPARASILTGQYAHNHGVLSNEPPWGGFEKFNDASTVATWLKTGGYNTLFLGKYLNRYGLTQPRYIPPGWTDWRASIDPTTYDFRGTKLNVNGTIVDHAGEFQTDAFAKISENLIARYAPADKPFFLWASYVAPHVGGPIEPDDPKAADPNSTIGTTAVPNRYRDAAAGTTLPRDASFNEADVSDKPAHIRSLTRMTDTQIGYVRESHQQRLEALMALDDAIDRTLNALAATGELKNTLIIYTSDNGYFLGEHRIRLGKVLPYEPSVRVPLIIRGPGIPLGVTRTQPVATVDLAATIADAADTTPGLPADGTSLIPLAKDPNQGTGRAMLLQAGPRGNTNARFYTAVRTLNFLYVEYDTGEHELYHLPTDPAQTTNLAGTPTYQTDQQRLTDLLHTIQNCAAQTCPR